VRKRSADVERSSGDMICRAKDVRVVQLMLLHIYESTALSVSAERSPGRWTEI
jgi:uncharacterized protein YcbK (DUF882 family)